MSDARTEPKPFPLNRDLACTHCGYNLRGLLATGQCPECGHDILTSIRGQTLYYCDDAWVGRLRLWLAIMAAVAVLHVLRDLGFCMTSEVMVRRIMPALLAVGDFLAVWYLTQPEPGVRRHDEPTRVRLLLLGCASIRVAVDLGWFILPNYFRSTFSPTTVLLLWAPWIWRLAIAAWATEAGLLFWYLRPLALRLPAPPLARQMRILAFLLPAAFLAAWLCTEPLIGRSRPESTVALVILGALGLWSAKVLFGLFLAIGRIDDGMGADAEYKE